MLQGLQQTGLSKMSFKWKLGTAIWNLKPYFRWKAEKCGILNVDVLFKGVFSFFNQGTQVKVKLALKWNQEEK